MCIGPFQHLAQCRRRLETDGERAVGRIQEKFPDQPVTEIKEDIVHHQRDNEFVGSRLSLNQNRNNANHASHCHGNSQDYDLMQDIRHRTCDCQRRRHDARKIEGAVGHHGEQAALMHDVDGKSAEYQRYHCFNYIKKVSFCRKWSQQESVKRCPGIVRHCKNNRRRNQKSDQNGRRHADHSIPFKLFLPVHLTPP